MRTASGEIELVYGYLAEALQVASLRAAESFVDHYEWLDTILSCRTWIEVREVLGPDDFEDEFGDYLDYQWYDEGRDDATERPESWLPSWDAIDYLSGDWLSEITRIDDPGKCDVPAAILDLGNHGWGMSGDFISWSPTTDKLNEIRTVVAANGWNLAERQDLFDRIKTIYH